MGMGKNPPGYKAKAFLCFMFASVWQSITGQIYYSIPEETEKGSLVGNAAKDLGLEAKKLSDHGVRIISQGRTQYFALNYNNGHLYTTERIDREEICGQATKCLINFEIIIGDTMKLFEVKVEITDINDNAPSFQSEKIDIEISETVAPGSQFPLFEAWDPDLGTNSLQGYKLSSSNHFSLAVLMALDHGQYAKLVLERPLDREEEPAHQLTLTAYDGGDPVRTSTVQVNIIVLDANDNAPIFSQPVYEVSIKEDTPVGITVVTLKATDLDEGINKELKYSFGKITEKASQIFHLDSNTGEITLVRNLDYEDTTAYEIEVQVHDGGRLFDKSKVVVSVIDVNDNAPELAITSLIGSVPEDSPAGTAIALLNVQDQDSAQNGEVTCSIPSDLPFKLKKSLGNYYSLETFKTLDREQMAGYNITVTALDNGTPSLSTTTIIPILISDINDNPPYFPQSSYSSYIMENNPRGTSIFSLKAYDPDGDVNSRITYFMVEGQMSDSLLSSYLSINSETGTVYALSSFDYEEFQEIQFQVKAQDGGSPPLSSNVSVTLFILDQNDNAPEILYPSPPTDGSTGVELAPRTSEPGYLVSKVVAVDADSGQSGWLSYQLIKATEPGLFTVGLHTGEIRTTRFFLEKDVLKQSLVVLVKDNGQPPLSTSVTVTVVLADSIPEVLSDLSSISVSVDPQSDLTFYLIISVASVSCLFFVFLFLLLALRLHRWRNSQSFNSGTMNISGTPVAQFTGINGVRAFLNSYCHDIYLTSDSRKSDFSLSKGNCSNTLTGQQPCEIKDPFLMSANLSSNNKEPPQFQVSSLHLLSDFALKANLHQYFKKNNVFRSLSGF